MCSHLFQQCVEFIAKASLRRFHDLQIFVEQNQPGAVVTSGFDQQLTGAVDQPVCVVFLCDELIHVADGAQDLVEMLDPLLLPHALGDVLCDTLENRRLALVAANGNCGAGPYRAHCPVRADDAILERGELRIGYG